MSNTRPATYEDVNLILRLYEMRREEKLRAARTWFSGGFKAKTVAEFNTIAPSNSGMAVFTRQVITYWDMVASFVNAGVLHQDLFFESGRELLFVWTRVEPILEEWRAQYQDPDYLKNLQTLGLVFAERMKSTTPEAYENFVKRVRG